MVELYIPQFISWSKTRIKMEQMVNAYVLSANCSGRSLKNTNASLNQIHFYLIQHPMQESHGVQRKTVQPFLFQDCDEKRRGQSTDLHGILCHLRCMVLKSCAGHSKSGMYTFICVKVKDREFVDGHSHSKWSNEGQFVSLIKAPDLNMGSPSSVCFL